MSNLGQIAALWISNVAPSNTSLIWDDTRIAGGVRHRYYDRAVGDWVLFNPSPNFRVTLSQSQTVIQIPDQENTDYEIEVVKYKIGGDNLKRGRDLLSIADADKTINSFTVNVDERFKDGVFIYRIIKF